jgi:SAM-dependent methyltransferase
MRAFTRRGRLANTLRRWWKGHTHPLSLREDLARRFIRGEGIEIGALHLPLKVPRSARVRYVDRFGDDLIAQFPDMAGEPLVTVDVIDDGERLTTFRPQTVDFIIANHFLEHTQDTLGVLARFLEVLRVGGVAFLCVPDKSGTFDRDRPVTPVEHLYKDHLNGGQGSYLDHVEEFVRLVQKLPESEVAAQVENITRSSYSIHYHVWTHDALVETLIDARRELGLPFELVAAVKNEPLSESICVLRRCAGEELTTQNLPLKGPTT